MIALVTGANRGIGLECVRQLAAQGHTVILGSRDFEKGLQAKASMGLDNNVDVQQLDVSDDASVKQLYEYVLDTYGRLDILVNNAGINYDTWQNVLNADFKNVKETIETNLFGPWRMIQLFMPLMLEHNYGRIVNVSSGAGAQTGMGSGVPGYGISKTALNALTIKTAGMVEGKDVLVNAVCPGWVRTDMGGASATRSVEEGAETLVWAANLESGGPNGGFFRDKAPISW